MATILERRRSSRQRSLDIRLSKGTASIILYPHSQPDLMPGTLPFLCLPTHGYLQEELCYHKPGPPGAVKEGTCWYHNLSGGFSRPSHTLLPQTWKWGFQEPYCVVQEVEEEKPQPFQGEMQASRFYLTLVAADMSNTA